MTAGQFRSELATTFPDVVAATRSDENGLLHCEVGAFRRCTEQAMDSGKHWLAERHFRFVELVMRDADDRLRNALEVSYLEDLALAGWTSERHRVVRERMPKVLREAMIRVSDKWR